MASVYTYSLAKDGGKYVSRNFRVHEFACKDGSDKILICPITVTALQAVRDFFGKPITITSGYRTPSHNKKVGGASASQHVVGTAVDFKVEGISPKIVVGFLEANYPTHGIGLYSSWVHLDSRGWSVYWINSGGNNKVVNGFGVGREYIKYMAKPNANEEQDMTIEEIKTALLKDKNFCIKAAEIYAENVSQQAAGTWSESARKWALSHGLFNDDKSWKSPLTREQAAQVFYNEANADDRK